MLVPRTILATMDGSAFADSTEDARAQAEAQPENDKLKTWVEVVKFVEVAE